MAEERFSRTELLIGAENLRRLAAARVAVFGLGGVGGYVVEALARSGIGTLDLIDNDRVCLSNLNRQILATERTIGQLKTDAARERVLQINPAAVVNVYPLFYLPETAGQFDFSVYDYVVDAIDTVTGKLMIVEQAYAAGTPVISCMGAGNKMDPTALRVADIYETSVCPLAKVMRRELKRRGIPSLKVVYSTEKAIRPGERADRLDGTGRADEAGRGDGAGRADGADRTVRLNRTDRVDRAELDAAPPQKEQPSPDSAMTDNPTMTARRSTPGSNAFVPAAAGLILAGEVIRDLIAWEFR